MNQVKAAGYVRRSTKDQAQSLERQRHEIERFARDRGVELVRWYDDDGISGTEDEARPGFQRMIADAERARGFSVILVHELSRFGRFDAHLLGSWLNRLRVAGVRVQGIAGSVRDPYSREGKLLLALEQDRQESVRLSMRTLSGQRETAIKGLRAGGKVPYGFARQLRRPDGTVQAFGRFGRAKRDKAEIVELVLGDPSEVEIVRSIFSWALEGLGYRSIAARLNERGIPSPDGPRGETIATKRGAWTSTTIRAMLRNPAYAGDAVWNVRSMPKFHRLEGDVIREVDEFEPAGVRKNARRDWITKRGAHPAIIDRATFDALQSRMAENPSMPRGRLHEYLLASFIACENCGNVMNGTTRTRVKRFRGEMRRYTYPGYVCSGGVKAKGCRQIAVPSAALEKAVIRLLENDVFSPEGIRALKKGIRLEMGSPRGNGGFGSVSDLESREKELSRKVSDGARRLLEVDESLIPDVRDALVGMKAELEGIRAALEEARRNASALKNATADERVAEAVAEVRRMAEALRDPAEPIECRREVLRRLLPRKNCQRPIRVQFDLEAGDGWRRTLRRATVTHYSLRRGERTIPGGKEVAPKVVAGTGVEPVTCGL
jgi:site-specific DNA recombinase